MTAFAHASTVDEFPPILGVEEADVIGMQISVDEAFVVQLLHSSEDLEHETRCGSARHW